jgi:hypothetical protein
MRKLTVTAMIGLIIVVLVDEWHELDHMGWIPHRQITHVWAPDEQPWQIGEYLDCMAQPRASMITPPGSPGIENLACMRMLGNEDRNGHLRPQDVEVTYWGRIAIPYPESAQLYRKIMTTPDTVPYDKRPFRWRCRRGESFLTCWAVN